SDKYIFGNALYHINNNIDAFREIIFKGFTDYLESLVLSIEKNSIVALVQTIPISSSDNEYILTPTDLLSSSPLLLFSAPVIQDVIFQVRANKYHLEVNKEPESKNPKQNNPPDTADSTFLSDTKNNAYIEPTEDNESVTTINTDLPVSQNKNTKQAKKYLRPLLSAK
ncbi:6762_t:CDS:2, partial [Cetraspora pellucida]